METIMKKTLVIAALALSVTVGYVAQIQRGFMS
jgi:hypothetical protein